MTTKFLKISFLSVLMFTGIGFSQAGAEANVIQEKNILYKSEEITDLNKLYNRALNREASLPGIDLGGLSPLSVSKLDESTHFDIQTNSTSQLLEIFEENGEIIETHAITTFNVAQDDADRLAQKQSDEMIRPMTTIIDEKWDSTYGVRSYSTIIFDKKYDKNSLLHFDLTKVSGGWSYNGVGGYILSNRSYKVGQNGTGSWGNPSKQLHSGAPTSNTFSYNVPTDWLPVAATTMAGAGVTTNIKITRSGSVWYNPFTNNAK